MVYGEGRSQTGLFCCITVESLSSVTLFLLYVNETQLKRRGKDKEGKSERGDNIKDKMAKVVRR